MVIDQILSIISNVLYNDIKPIHICKCFIMPYTYFRTDIELTLEDTSSRLRPSLENLNEHDHATTQLDQADQSNQRSLTMKIRVEGTVDLSTKTRVHHQDKENVGQDLTTTARRAKEEEVELTEREAIIRPRRERSPKPRQVWRPY